MGRWERAMGMGWTRVVVPRGGSLEEIDGPYEVHASGKVRNGDTGRELKPYPRGGPDGDEYLAVELTAGPDAPGQVYVHQLVAWAFVPGWNPGQQVSHQDDDPHNNHQANLGWIEAERNLERRGG